jgi:hypothetical protein
MKSAISWFLTSLLLAGFSLLLALVSLLPPAFGRRRGWVLLGERLLKAREGEADVEIVPLQTRGARPRALQLRVLRAAAGLRALTLRFADGEAREVPLDANLPPGAPSAIIDLPPRSRPLRSLELRYDLQGSDARESGGALVRVYGLV